MLGDYQSMLLINTCEHTVCYMFLMPIVFIIFMFLLACYKYLHFASAARHTQAKERHLNEGRLTAAIAACGWTGNEPDICSALTVTLT